MSFDGQCFEVNILSIVVVLPWCVERGLESWLCSVQRGRMVFTVRLPDFIDPEEREATHENLTTLSGSQLVEVLEWLEVEFSEDATESELVQLVLWEINRSEAEFRSWCQSVQALALSSCSLGYQGVGLADTWSGAESGGSDSVMLSVLEGSE